MDIVGSNDKLPVRTSGHAAFENISSNDFCVATVDAHPPPLVLSYGKVPN